MPEAARASGTPPAGYEDGLGLRFRPAARGTGEPPVEILCFRHEITDVPTFDFALRERVARLSDLNHPYYARIRKVDRLSDAYGTVTLTSDAAIGVRLIDILKNAERGGPAVDLNAALYLVRQLLSATSVLHEQTHIAHGAITPDRLFVTSAARLVVVEHVLGAALEQLNYSRERYWQELRVALPMRGGPPRFDERTDLTQIGVVALCLILGRSLRDTEYPSQIEEIVASAPVSSNLREWLRRMLQLDVRNSFGSIVSAQASLDQSLSEGEKESGTALPLEAFLTRYRASTAFDLASSRPSVVSETPFRPLEAKAKVLPSDSRDLESLPVEKLAGEWTHDRDDHEEPMKPTQVGKRNPSRMNMKWIAAGIALLVGTTGVVFATRHFAPAAPAPLGTISVTTEPPGAEVEIDGAKRGLTPVNLSLATGAHTLVVRGNGESRTIPITVEAGGQISQYLEFSKKATPAFGQLQIRTEPAGARVTLDGTSLGKTPITVGEIAPGEHTVVLAGDTSSVTHKVMVEAGAQASLVVPMGAQADTLTGYLSVKAPLVFELYEQGRLLGTSGIDRIMLPAGKHEIELVNGPLDYRERRTLQVTPGKVSTIDVTLPKGTVSINAVPWASVSIDGQSIGDTPIANISLTIGPHEVVLKNTTLGEQRRVITVTQNSPVRLGVDMAKK